MGGRGGDASTYCWFEQFGFGEGYDRLNHGLRLVACVFEQRQGCGSGNLLRRQSEGNPMRTPKSDILYSAVKAELEVNARFEALTDPQKLQVLESAQQRACDFYCDAGKSEYEANTLDTPTALIGVVASAADYVARITQAGIDDPSAQVLTRSYADPIVWTRSAEAQSDATLVGGFDPIRTRCEMDIWTDVESFAVVSADVVRIVANNDGVLVGRLVSIRTYPSVVE
jgi:hypothetical protein